MPPKGRHEPGRRQVHGQVEGLLAAGAEAHDHQAEREAACPVTALPRPKSKIWRCGVECYPADADDQSKTEPWNLIIQTDERALGLHRRRERQQSTCCPCTFVFVVLRQDSLNLPAAALEYSRKGFFAAE